MDRYDDLSRVFVTGSEESREKRVELTRRQLADYTNKRGLPLLSGTIDTSILPRIYRAGKQVPGYLHYWNVSKFDEEKSDLEVPDEVLQRYLNLKEAGIPKLSLVLCEEFFDEKKTAKRSTARALDILLDPILLWLAPTFDESYTGIGIVIGVWKSKH